MEFLNVFGNAIWVGVAGASIYFGLKSDIRQLRSDIKNAVKDNGDDHEYFKKVLEDHEDRMRVTERTSYMVGSRADG